MGEDGWEHRRTCIDLTEVEDVGVRVCEKESHGFVSIYGLYYY